VVSDEFDLANRPNDLTASTVGSFLNDLRPVEMRATGIAWYTKQLYPEADGPAWPLGLPRAVRTVSRLRGLKVRIPTDFNGSAAFAPIYVPRYAPIIPAGQYDAAADTYRIHTWTDNKGVSRPAPLMIYDLRYHAVPFNQLRYYGQTAVGQAVPGAITFTGLDPTHNDLHVTCRNPQKLASYTVTMTNDAVPFEYDWSDTLGNTGSGRADTPTALGNGVTISFTAPGNHHVGEKWTFALQYPNTALAYAVDPTGKAFQLLPANFERTLRITFYYYDPTANNAIRRYPASGIPVPVTIDKHVEVVKCSDLPDAPPASARIVPGSEQINRAYTWDASGATAPADLATGHYYIPIPATLPAGSAITDYTLLGAITFSRADAGRTVKMDYTVADWNILHEDVTVDNDGYLTLSVPDTKVTNKPNFPREPVTLGLYHPLTTKEADYKGQEYVNCVLGLVNLQNGLVSHVAINNPNEQRNPTATPFWLGVKKGAAAAAWHQVVDIQDQFSPSMVSAVGLDDVARGRIRVGVRAAGGDPNWSALAGQSFRVFYRARRDWTLQVLRAPALFGYYRLDATAGEKAASVYLGWDMFTADATKPQDLYVSGMYAGHTVAVDYAYWDTARASDVCALTAAAAAPAINGTVALAVDDTAGLRARQAIHLMTPGGTTVYTAQLASIDTATGITVTNISIPSGTALPIGTRVVQVPLVRVNGETHAIPTPDAGEWNARVPLSHAPASNTLVTVRGVSVTVRALWAQPRNGTAVVYDTGGTIRERPINQRWQARAVTMLLQPSRE
jgi:hypothetical protein